MRKKLSNSCLYLGRVKHTRFHEHQHHLNYPLFLSYIDLAEIEEIGWSLWPIFKVNGGAYTFCSLDYKDHLKGYESSQAKGKGQRTLYSTACSFVSSKTKRPKYTPKIKLMSHLTYFGYCFNPIAIFYVFDGSSDSSRPSIDSVIAEVSNTPWGEMHPYMLHESIESVKVTRNEPAGRRRSRSISSDASRGRSRSARGTGTKRNQRAPAASRLETSIREKSEAAPSFEAEWAKEFHVSPFMQMHYMYKFAFSAPGERVWVRSQMHNMTTKQLAFTASFDMDRVEITPLTLLYVLLFYPLHTRIIQLWIHIEAAKLWWKGVTFFPHPLGHDIDLGFGITGEGLGAVFQPPITFVTECLRRLGWV